MVKTAAQFNAEISAALKDGRFLVEIFDTKSLPSVRSKPTITLRRKTYREALKAATDELLGSGGNLAKIYMDGSRVAEGYLESRPIGKRGNKFSVRFVGEKPAR